MPTNDKKKQQPNTSTQKSNASPNQPYPHKDKNQEGKECDKKQMDLKKEQCDDSSKKFEGAAKENKV